MSAVLGTEPTAPVRWGFLGAGWIAHRALAPAVHAAAGAVLHAAAARDTARARTLGTSRVYESYEALIADPEVEAVYVSLTNEMHLPWAQAALEAGKHVLCEKPLGLSAAEVRTMAEAARRSDRLLVEAAWSRWHPRTRRAQAILASDAIGTVLAVEAGFTFGRVSERTFRLDPHRGGGALYDVGPYVVGAALWAVPVGQVSVIAVDCERHPDGVDLTTQARLRIGEATVATRTSMDEVYGEWLRIAGEHGRLSLDTPAYTSWLAASTMRLNTETDDLTFEFAPVDAYQLMIEQVSRRIRGDASAWLVPLEESLRAAEVMDAIRALSL